MDKQEDLVLKPGETRIVDEEGHTLLTIELTPNQFVVIGADGMVIQRSWRSVVNWLAVLPPRQRRHE